MHVKKQVRSGILYSIATAVLWSTFPVFSVISLKILPAMTVAALANFFAMIFFLGVVLVKGEWKKPSKDTIRNIAMACLLIGVLYYGFIYVGLTMTTPGNAAIIGLSEVLYSYLFISVIGRHERLVFAHVLGAIFMIGGMLFVLLPSFHSFHAGDFLILIAGILPPFGNLAMQRARKEVSASFIMFWRSLSATVPFLILAFVFDATPSLDTILTALPLIAFVGVVILGFSKILWIESIHRLPVTQSISIISAQPLLTLLFAYLLLGQQPEKVQLLSLPPLLLGLWLLTKTTRSMKEPDIVAV